MRISRPGKWRQMFLSKFWLVPIPCWIQGWKVVSPAKVDFRFWPRKLQTLKIPDFFQRDTSVALQTSRYIMVSCCFQPPSERCFLSPPTGGWVTIFSSLLHCNPRGSRLEPNREWESRNRNRHVMIYRYISYINIYIYIHTHFPMQTKFMTNSHFGCLEDVMTWKARLPSFSSRMLTSERMDIKVLTSLGCSDGWYPDTQFRHVSNQKLLGALLGIHM